MHDDIELPEGLPDEAYELGAPVDAFYVSAKRATLVILHGLLLIVSGLVILGVMILTLMKGGLPVKGVIVFLVMAGMAGAGGFGLLIRGFTRRGTGVLVFHDGFVYLGDDVDVVRWDEVAMLQHKLGRSWLIYYTVERRSDGREFIFERRVLSRYRQLLRLIEERTLEPLLGRALKRFEAGETVRFGPLALGANGIWNGYHWLPWSQVKDIKHHEYGIAIWKKNQWIKWHNQRSIDVPNHHVFVEIVRRQLERYH